MATCTAVKEVTVELRSKQLSWRKVGRSSATIIWDVYLLLAIQRGYSLIRCLLLSFRRSSTIYFFHYSLKPLQLFFVSPDNKRRPKIYYERRVHSPTNTQIPMTISTSCRDLWKIKLLLLLLLLLLLWIKNILKFTLKYTQISLIQI